MRSSFHRGLGAALVLFGPGYQGLDGAGFDSGPGTEATSDTGDAPTCGRNRRPPSAPDDETIAVSVVDHDVWAQLAAEDDPLAAHRPETLDCGPLGWEVEFDGFEVETIGCNYMAAGQTTLVELCAGDQIRFDFQHFNLISNGPAQAHAAVFLGEQALLDYVVDIDPENGTAARKWDEMIEIENDLPSGAPVYLHIHNHGFNTYKLLKVDLMLPPPG